MKIFKFIFLFLYLNIIILIIFEFFNKNLFLIYIKNNFLF